VETVWKLRVGAEAYYLQQVARGLEEYYTGAGGAPGYWTGSGVAALGLTGQVDPADLRAVLAGLAPGTGLSPNGTTLQPHPRRVPGFDITFSVPKSVSLAYEPPFAWYSRLHSTGTSRNSSTSMTTNWLPSNCTCDDENSTIGSAYLEIWSATSSNVVHDSA
jgi:hypothetical protein